MQVPSSSYAVQAAESRVPHEAEFLAQRRLPLRAAPGHPPALLPGDAVNCPRSASTARPSRATKPWYSPCRWKSVNGSGEKPDRPGRAAKREVQFRRPGPQRRTNSCGSTSSGSGTSDPLLRPESRGPFEKPAQVIQHVLPAFDAAADVTVEHRGRIS